MLTLHLLFSVMTTSKLTTFSSLALRMEPPGSSRTSETSVNSHMHTITHITPTAVSAMLKTPSGHTFGFSVKHLAENVPNFATSISTRNSTEGGRAGAGSIGNGKACHARI